MNQNLAVMRCVIYLCATIPALTFSLTWYYGNCSFDFVPKCKKPILGKFLRVLNSDKALHHFHRNSAATVLQLMFK